MPKNHDPFPSIDPRDLCNVGGGSSRITARTNTGSDQLTLMMSQITDAIKAMSTTNNQSDPMQMMMMMMMMGGLGGGGGGGGGAPMSAGPPPQAAPAPVINITTTVKRHGW